MEELEPEGDLPTADVYLCGHLRKQKSLRRRFFVLRAPSEHGPARLEYYESEKKFRAGSARPKRSFPLASALNINKRADARHRHLIVLYGRDGTFGLAAESSEQQEAWYHAMVELRAKGPSQPGSGMPFREVWQVSLRPKGLGQARNLVGVYRLCLASSTVELVRLNAATACLVLQLLSVRRCGHSENYFFLEVGRSAATGPGELWMQVEDLVVAQHIHETFLEAMKALSEEGRLRGRGQTSAPISVPPRRLPPIQMPPSQAGSGRRSGASKTEVPPSDDTLASSDEGGSSSPGEVHPADSPEERALASLLPLALSKGGAQRKPASYPEGLNRGADPGYMAMLPRVAPGPGEPDYMPMSPGSASPPQDDAGGYMVMSPSETWVPEYMNMSPLCRSAGSTPLRRSPLPGAPRDALCPFHSLPRSFKHGTQLARPGCLSSSSTSSESLEEIAPQAHRPPSSFWSHSPVVPAAPRSPGEYVSIKYQPSPEMAKMKVDPSSRQRCCVETSGGRSTWPSVPTAWEEASSPEPGLNYIDLDLAKEEVGPDGNPRVAGSTSPHAYAHIDFHRSQGLRGRQGGQDGPEC